MARIVALLKLQAMVEGLHAVFLTNFPQSHHPHQQLHIGDRCQFRRQKIGLFLVVSFQTKDVAWLDYRPQESANLFLRNLLLPAAEICVARAWRSAWFFRRRSLGRFDPGAIPDLDVLGCTREKAWKMIRATCVELRKQRKN